MDPINLVLPTILNLKKYIKYYIIIIIFEENVIHRKCPFQIAHLLLYSSNQLLYIIY